MYENNILYAVSNPDIFFFDFLCFYINKLPVYVQLYIHYSIYVIHLFFIFIYFLSKWSRNQKQKCANLGYFLNYQNLLNQSKYIYLDNNTYK